MTGSATAVPRRTNAATPLFLLVLVKFTVDVNQLRIDPATMGPDLAGAPVHINDFDTNAIEEAVRLKEKHAGRVVALSVVSAEPPRDILLRVMAMGVDTLYLVSDAVADCGDSLVVASLLAAAVREISAREAIAAPDLILCGDASVDSCNAQTGPRLAEALGLPSVTGATRVSIGCGSLTAERALESSVQIVETDLPALVTVGMETNQPRLPTVLQIMGAGRKPVLRLNADRSAFKAMAEGCDSLRTLSVVATATARRRIVVGGDGPDETATNLIRYLRETGEVNS